MLDRNSILTLPQKDEVSSAIFPIGSRVITLYPQTTTFYPATICGHFIKGRVSDLLRFGSLRMFCSVPALMVVDSLILFLFPGLEHRPARPLDRLEEA